MRCRIESGRDIVVGSFLCSLVLLVSFKNTYYYLLICLEVKLIEST